MRADVLRDSRDFKKLYRKGTSVGSRYVVLIFLKNGLPFNRYAYLASKKVGDSVRRNRARRLMRESLRGQKGLLKQGYDILYIARNTIADKQVKCGDVLDSVKKTLKKGALYK
ncbi:MAG: ribonuclease P protein component [Clostridiales Family XIII bacterium]|jgi:ribonuclease P protein component|nr:ribonuclease P protein component [Clostridiales Family XIII bacterium]